MGKLLLYRGLAQRSDNLRIRPTETTQILHLVNLRRASETRSNIRSLYAHRSCTLSVTANSIHLVLALLRVQYGLKCVSVTRQLACVWLL